MSTHRPRLQRRSRHVRRLCEIDINGCSGSLPDTRRMAVRSLLCLPARRWAWTNFTCTPTTALCLAPAWSATPDSARRTSAECPPCFGNPSRGDTVMKALDTVTRPAERCVDIATTVIPAVLLPPSRTTVGRTVSAGSTAKKVSDLTYGGDELLTIEWE